MFRFPFPILSKNEKVKHNDMFRAHFSGAFPGLSWILSRLNNMKIPLGKIRFVGHKIYNRSFYIDFIYEDSKEQILKQPTNIRPEDRKAMGASLVVGGLIVIIAGIFVMFTLKKVERLLEIKPIHLIFLIPIGAILLGRKIKL